MSIERPVLASLIVNKSQLSRHEICGRHVRDLVKTRPYTFLVVVSQLDPTSLTWGHRCKFKGQTSF